jgi:hypothetical protein
MIVATENTAAPKPATPSKPATPVSETIARLKELQGEMTDKDFCREYNFGFHESTWSKVKRGVYGGDAAKAETACASMLRRIQERKAIAQKVRGGIKFLDFTPMQTVLDRIGILLEEPTGSNQNRLVMYLAPSGGGKTTLARETAARHGGIVVEGRESWRGTYGKSNGYNNACLDICRAIGVTETDIDRNPRLAEAALIKFLKARKIVLVIDEGEYFGPQTLNLIKLILNQTPTIVLLLAIPELWDRVQKKGYVEAQQIMRRTDHVERLEHIHPPEVERFLTATGVNLNGSAKRSSEIVAKHANEFGRFDLIKRVAQRLNDGEAHTADEVETTAMAVKAMLGFREGGAK